MDSWKFESHYGKQLALGLAAIAVGAVLMAGFRHFDASDLTSSLAGFLLGAFLLFLGFLLLLTRGKQTVVVDPAKRRIVIEDATLFGIRQRVIGFHDIVRTGIGYLGKKSSFVNFYSINLHLRSGKVYSLFPPGRFYEGGSDRQVMETRRQQLEEMMRQNPG